MTQNILLLITYFLESYLCKPEDMSKNIHCYTTYNIKKWK